MAFKSCKACGNRYPEKDGVGPENEFCCEGCWEEWEQKHPGYTKETTRNKILGFIVLAIILCVVMVKCCAKIGPV